MGAKQLAVAAVLGIGVLSSSAPTAVLELEVTYTVGGVDSGTLCGWPSLPTDVVFNVSFVGNRFSENIVAADNAVVTALIQFDDATWTETDVEFFEVCYSNGVAFELNWQMFRIDTSTRREQMTWNFPLTIEGKCVGAGGPFQYTYTNSSQVLTVTCPWDCSAVPNGAVDVPDLLALLADWGLPGSLCQFDGGGAVAVPDLLALLANWGPLFA